MDQGPTGAARRIAGFDLARAGAICFMVLENFKVLMLGTGGEPHVLVWLATVPNGRSAPLFVVLAGVSLSLISRAARRAGDRRALASVQKTLLLRALFFLVLGNLFILVWWIDILHFYAWYVGLGALLFLGASRRRLLWSAALIALVGNALAFVRGDAYYDRVEYWSPLGMVRDTFLDGVHPVLPWLAFVLFGMWLGRLDFEDARTRGRVLLAAVLTFLGAELLSVVVTRLAVAGTLPLPEATPLYLLTTRMCPPGPLYLIAACATSAAAVAACHAAAARWPTGKVVRSLVAAGQVSLTLYIAHAIVGAGLLWAMGRLEDHSPGFVFLYTATYLCFSVLAAAGLRRRFRRGPLEWLMRRVSGSPSRPARPVPHRAAPATETAPPLPSPLWVVAVAAALVLVYVRFFGVDNAGEQCPTRATPVVDGRASAELTVLCRDRWFEMEVEEQTELTLAARSAFDTYLELYRADEEEILEEDDDSGPGFTPSLTTTLEPGRYLVKVRPYRAGTGPIVLTVQ